MVVLENSNEDKKENFQDKLIGFSMFNISYYIKNYFIWLYGKTKWFKYNMNLFNKPNGKLKIVWL